MIRKTTIIFIILLFFHFVLVLLNPEMGEGTHQWQDNVIKAQSYLYSDNTDTVIVGSSLSARIQNESIPSIKSLAFAGCSVEDGLRIILAKEKKPKYVLIESNYFFKNSNPLLFSNQTNFFLYKLKKYIPSLREQYEPICLLIYGIREVRRNHKKRSITIKPVNYSLLNKEIKRRKEKTNTALDKEVLSSRLKLLKSIMNNLEHQGVKFIFFEMPVNKQVYELKGFVQTRNTIRTEFPDKKYKRLPSDTTNYITTDGIHLDDRGALIYTQYFKHLLSQIDL